MSLTERRRGTQSSGIGASAGGLEAFTALLQHLSLDTGMGFVLVQHLDPQHESALTHLLARATSIPVREVTNNLRVAANCVYVIPPNTNLTIAQGVLKLQPRPETRGSSARRRLRAVALPAQQGRFAAALIYPVNVVRDVE